jgi:hypothetical protein
MYFAIDLEINNRNFLYTNIRLVFRQHTFFFLYLNIILFMHIQLTHSTCYFLEYRL